MTSREAMQDVSQAKQSFDNDFEVSVPPDRAWPVLSNIPRIVTFIPEVTLTQAVDDRTYEGVVSLELGPVNVSFSTEVTVQDLDPTTYTARLAARGRDKRDNSGADGLISFQLVPYGDGSKVLVHTDVALLGPVARYGNLDMVRAAAAQMISQFAENLRAELNSTKGQPPKTASSVSQA